MRGVAFAVAASLTVMARCAYADAEAARTSYTQVSGQYVFVMLGEGPLANRESVPYPRSGLYSKDGSHTPLWTVDWYAHRVELLPDGSHLVRWGPWATSTDDEALSFFTGPRLVKSYAVRDVVTVPWLLPRSVSHFEWCKSSRLDAEARTLTIQTHDGNRIIFSVDSGEQIFRSSPGLRVAWVVAAAAAAAGSLLWRSRRHRRALSAGAGGRPTSASS